MATTKLTFVLLTTIAMILRCDADRNTFKFLNAADKCALAIAPQLCLKKNFDKFCIAKPSGKRVQAVCDCLETRYSIISTDPLCNKMYYEIEYLYLIF